MGYPCKELPVPKGESFACGNLGTISCQCKELPVPKDRTRTNAKNCLLPNIGIHCSELETVGCDCKEMPCLVLLFEADWYITLCFAYWSGSQSFVFLIGPIQNALFPCWSGTRRFVFLIPIKNAWFSLLVLFPNLKLLVPTLGTIGYQCEELLVPRSWNPSFLTSEA